MPELSVLRDFPAASDYLSDMYLIQRDYGSISNQQLASRLQVSSSAVSQAIGRLKKLGLVSQEPYGAMTLTAEGRELAIMVLRRHYLLEHLLVRQLGYPWDKADAEARILQNHISEDLARHLDQKLGYPQTCPHGNPLPGVAMEATLLAAPRLDSLEPGQTCLVLRITEEGESVPAMLPFCESHGIRPAVHLRLVARVDDGLKLQRSAGEDRIFIMPAELARHIGVQAT